MKGIGTGVGQGMQFLNMVLQGKISIDWIINLHAEYENLVIFQLFLLQIISMFDINTIMKISNINPFCNKFQCWSSLINILYYYMISDNVFFWLADVPSNDLYKTL